LLPGPDSHADAVRDLLPGGRYRQRHLPVGVGAIHLQQWNELGASGGRAGSTVQLGHLVQALSRAETADEVARVVAEAGAIAAGAEFANIAVANLSAGHPGTANLYHASSLAE